MKILFIDPPWYSLQGMSTAPLPLGLGYLASYLKKYGHKCRILSGEIGIGKSVRHQKVVLNEGEDSLNNLKKSKIWKVFLGKLAFLIKTFNPEIIALGVPSVKFPISLEIVNFVKKNHHNVRVIFGGPHPTILPEETVKSVGVDFVVRGEGEETIKELVEAIEKGRKSFDDIKGVSFMKGGKVKHNKDRPGIANLDDLPFPDWDLLYEHEKLHRSYFGTIIGSRGCPYQCIFCASKRIWGLNVRYRSPENIIQEIKDRTEKYGVNLFNFNDDSFTIRKDYVMRFCDMLIKEGIKIEWKCDTRVNLIDYELLKKMKEAGCIKISLGIECGNDKMLKYVKKGITTGQVEKAFNIARKLGIETMAYFMMGFPDETRKDIKDSIELMKKINPSHSCWSIATPYPGTELYEICEKEGMIKKEIDWGKFHHHSSEMGFSKNIPRHELVGIAKKIEGVTFRMKIIYYLTHPKRLLKELKII